MVSARPLVVLGLTAFLALASPRARADAPDDAANSRVAASSPSQVSPAPVPIEDRPYKIRAWVSLDPRCRLDYRGRAELIAGWQTLITRFVGLPWDVEVAEGPGPLRGGELKDLTAEMIGPEAKGFDKAWAFTIGPIEGGYGVTLSGREFDAATGQVGLVGTRAVPSTADAPRGLLMLALELFAPTAEISKKVGGGADIKVHGSMLPAADPVGRVVQIGSVFKIARVAYRPDGSVAKILPIPRTYLRVDAIDGATTHCDIITKLRDPLTRLVVGQTKIVAVGVKPSALPTRLQFLSRPPERRPLAGYTVTARPAPDGPARVVAVTDRDGRVVLPPYFDNRLVILRLVAADLEPLDEFPIMPGETEELRTIANVDPKRDAVTLETDLIALRDELIDQWSVRARLDALILPRVQQEAWDEVRLLLEEYDKLRKQDYYKGRLEALQQAAAARQQEIRKPVLTRTAQRLAAENSAVIESYIDDELFASYADAYDRYAATAPPKKARRKTLPSGRPEDDLAGLSTPSASGAGLEEDPRRPGRVPPFGRDRPSRLPRGAGAHRRSRRGGRRGRDSPVRIRGSCQGPLLLVGLRPR